MAYKTNVNYKRRKAYKSRFSKRLKNNKKKRGKKKWSKSALGKSSLKTKMKKLLGIFGGLVFVVIFLATIFSLSVVAKYSSELPNPDEPFERGQDLTSYVHDRNGKELYKIHGDENREIAQIEDVPLETQWAFMAAEDMDFYTHKGVDMGGLVKAGMYEVFGVGGPRGGSTITQQMIKNTVLTSERSYERKIKEMILSLRIEQKYEKNEVLQLYLNEIGFGGNTYGVKTAARIYFGREVEDLTLAESALLAGLPQAPGLYSPLFASDVTQARELAKNRQNYVLDQMLDKKDTINKYAKEYNDWESEEDFITEEKIQAAREQEIVYKTSDVNIEAPHFVFYVEDELQKGNYNDGKPFTLSEVERGGLKITTSLDLDMQHVAEETVRNGLETHVKNKGLGGNNAALVTIDPKTGQILAMVGSADYFAQPSPEGCTLGADCKFEPKVNVSLALRQPGSSLKPMVYYSGFETGQLYPASILPDIPITFNGNYEPKNYGGDFLGQPWTARRMLYESRNIPAVEAIEIVGVTNFLNTLEKFGYSTFTQPENYGPAVALGAGDVKLAEHTNGYSVLATGGEYHPLSPILKIEDKEGNIIYEYESDESRKGVRVADERAAYLVTDILRNYHYTPPAGYEFAGKTGTSDENRNTYYMGYSTEVVTGIWVGNNDNSRMTYQASGWMSARPIWTDYTNKIYGRFSPSTFPRPGGIVSGTVCSDSGLLANDHCEKISDLFIEGMLPAQDSSQQEIFRVCSDQPERLARDIDEQLGFATDKVYRYIKAPKEEWQKYWDTAFGQGAQPVDLCDVNRNPTGSNQPWVVISEPIDGTTVNQGEQLRVDATAYAPSAAVSKIEVYIDSTYITQATNNPLVANITVPGSIADGTHQLIVKAYDDSGRSGSSSVNIIVGDVVTLTNPADLSSFPLASNITIKATHAGTASINYAKVTIGGVEYDMDLISGDNYQYIWAPGAVGTFVIRVRLGLDDGSQIYSNQVKVDIT